MAPISVRSLRSVLLLVAAAFAATSCTKPDEAPAAKAAQPAAASTAAASTAAAPAPAAGVPEQVKRITGRWLREDGGYVLEIKGGASGGVLEAKYFNPRSINVSRAAWYEGAGKLQVLVELNDTGYPGATYILSHDAKADKLVGEYRQPAMQQSFEIEFIREPKQ